MRDPELILWDDMFPHQILRQRRTHSICPPQPVPVGRSAFDYGSLRFGENIPNVYVPREIDSCHGFCNQIGVIISYKCPSIIAVRMLIILTRII
jgi:hypothetical protein